MCVCAEKKREPSTGCQSHAGQSLSLLDRARPEENGSPWDSERIREEVEEAGRWSVRLSGSGLI